MGKITIIIPIYNGQNFIRNGLESIVRQTIGLEQIEVLMIDDLSNDNTRDILKEYEENYPGIFKAIYLQENSGHSSIPRNKGLDLATGEYIMFMDQDDWYLDDACEKLLNGLRLNDSDIAIGWYQSKYCKQHCTIPGYRYVRKFVDNLDFMSKIGPDIWSNIYKKEVIDQHSLRLPGFALAEDLYFVTAYCFYADGIQTIPDTVYYYNVRDEEDLSVFHTKSERMFNRLNTGYLDVLRMMKEEGNEQYYPIIMKKHFEVYVNGVIHSNIIPLEKKIALLSDVNWLARYLENDDFPIHVQVISNLLLKQDKVRLTKLLMFEILSEKIIQASKKSKSEEKA